MKVYQSLCASYLPTGFIVVKVHEGPVGRLALSPLPHIHKGLGEGHPIGYVIRAARPLEPYGVTPREDHNKRCSVPDVQLVNRGRIHIL